MPRAVVEATDAACDAIRAQIAEIERKIAQLSGRREEMAGRVQAFQVAQFRALGEVLAECLRLRLALAQRRADLSGDADDVAAAAEAARDQDDYAARLDRSAAPAGDGDADEREELKRLYRYAAMRCHPDRVADGDKALAQEHFQRVQRAYRQGCLADLRELVRRLDDAPLQGRGADSGDRAEALERALSALRNEAADLILAIQTLQIDPDYRRALDPDGWQPYFDEARRGFAFECDELRRALAALERPG